ncbi:universal stress protein [Marinomonas transparens]|uniref:Universal stress protein n=1 Tax=Marinomonas transparens TaxID=2795388 RepID=A0A934JZ48_9GAMM|nr:universal stress protein [Marinomonas transparens]MBJ7539577.1 universal stress protein [Marinomonas transparens]
MYNTVLVPIDLAEKGYTDKVIENALHLLKPDGNLILLTAVAGYQMPIVGSHFKPGTFDKAVKQVHKKLIDFVSDELPIDAETCTIKVIEGKPAETILSVAKDSKVDVIVMASHKQSRVGHMMVGSIANKVLGLANIPVMVIKG